MSSSNESSSTVVQPLHFPLMDAELSSYRAAESAGTGVGQCHSAMESSKGKLTSIGNLTTRLPQACLPNHLRG